MGSIVLPYYAKLGLNPDDYKNINLAGLDFSYRLSTRLEARNLVTVADLLKTSEESLREIKGFGKGCFDEINNYFNTLKGSQVTKTGRKTITPELYSFLENIFRNDFSFVDEIELSQDSLDVIDYYKQGFALLDYELIEEAVNGTSEIYVVMEALTSFIKGTEDKAECKRRVELIPKGRRSIDVDWLIFAYTKNEGKKEILLSYKTEDSQNIEQYIYANIERIINDDSALNQFLSWCCFDTLKEIVAYFDKLNEDERIKLVLKKRANKETLETVGNLIGVTRERVRQIEAKAVRKFRSWESRNRSLLKIFTDFKENTALSSIEIEEYVGSTYGKLYLYLMQTDAATFDDCIFDKQLDMFMVEGNSTAENVQQYVEELPETFSENKLESLLKYAEEEFEYPRKMVLSAINDSYRKTGEVYHRTRLTLANVYADILRKYYPEGMHIYDDCEMNQFKQHVFEEYGIELTQRNRAIGAVLSRVGILCGRGIYRINDQKFISDDLAKKIHDYIANSESPIFLTNTLFSIFEEELVSEGINNKYFLQGILHELFGEEWLFKRDYVSKDEGFTSVYAGIIGFIKKSPYPVKKEEIFKAFPGITEIIVNIAVSDPDVLNLFGSYIHGSRLKLEEADITYLRKTVDKFIEQKDVWHCKHIYEYVAIDYPSLLTNNYINIPFCMYSLLEFLFRNDYEFSRPYIAKNGVEIERTYDVLKEMIQDSDQMSITEILTYARTNYHQINSILEFLDTCNETHLLISSDEIASIEIIGITDAEAKEIESIILEEVTDTLPISQLKCIHRFPKLNVQWNEWLIYSVIKKWGIYLEVMPSANQFRQSVPLIARRGQLDTASFENISLQEAGTIAVADDLSNIDELIGDYLLEGMEGLDDI